MKIVSVNIQLSIPDKITMPMLEEEFEEFIKSKKWQKEAISVMEDDEIFEILRLEDEEDEDDEQQEEYSRY